jgi:hypothetical protein
MISNLGRAVKKAAKEAKYWAYAAWTAPFVALAALTIQHYIGLDSWLHATVLGITCTFFAFSVYWWWWALNRVVEILAAMKRNDEHFYDVKHELRKTRQLIREIENDVGNR